MSHEKQYHLIESLMDSCWSHGKDITDPAVVENCLELNGIDPIKAFEYASSPEGKDAVRRQTEEAIEAGVFGVPTMAVGKELFWGVDSLPFVGMYGCMQ